MVFLRFVLPYTLLLQFLLVYSAVFEALVSGNLKMVISSFFCLITLLMEALILLNQVQDPVTWKFFFSSLIYVNLGQKIYHFKISFLVYKFGKMGSLPIWLIESSGRWALILLNQDPVTWKFLFSSRIYVNLGQKIYHFKISFLVYKFGKMGFLPIWLIESSRRDFFLFSCFKTELMSVDLGCEWAWGLVEIDGVFCH